MFALNHRRDFVHKRNLARANPLGDTSPASVAPTPAIADPKATPSSNPLPSIVPDPKKSDTPTPSATPASPTPSAPSSPSASSASPSSEAQSASSSKPSSAASTASASAATALTPAVFKAQATQHGPAVSTQVVGVSFTPSSTLSSSISPSTTSSPGSSTGTNTGAIIGGVAGTLAGIAILAFFLMWCMRRQRDKDNIDDFDAQAFRRQSAVLLDDPVEPSRSYNPRPPTMIERHNASPALAAQAGFGGQNFYGNYGGYGQQSAYPEMIQPAVSPPPQAYGAPPAGYGSYNDPQLIRQPSTMGHASYDPQQQLARQPSDAGYLTRYPSAAAGYGSAPAASDSLDPNSQYINLDRSSVSPYQAAQYADISRQLGTTDPNVDAPRPLDLPDAPLPSPFDDPGQATLPSHAHQNHTSVSHTQSNATESHGRPSTVYEEGDAYGGI